MYRQNLCITAALLFSAMPSIAEGIRVIASTDLEWETTAEGVAFAALQGDRFQEPYQAMVRLPAGTISPPHIKSANMSGVMIKGQMIHYADGTDPSTATPIGPGAFYRIPAGMAHISACVSENTCVVYLTRDDAFDFLPVVK
jgi:uncharacterized RmlC-like cupin family protein